MSQQINLLRAKDRSAGAAAWALGAAGVVLVAMAAYYQSVHSETSRLREVARLKEAQLAQLKGAIQKLALEKAKQNDAAALDAEIAAMRPRADALSQLVKQVRSGNPGNPEGFARYLQTLGSLSEEGLWVTNLSVSKGGTAVIVSGRALRNEAVMQYARRLNDAFAGHGVRFNSLELTPEALHTPGSAAGSPPALSLFAFKLS
jgi:hypothetical protein